MLGNTKPESMGRVNRSFAERSVKSPSEPWPSVEMTTGMKMSGEGPGSLSNLRVFPTLVALTMTSSDWARSPRRRVCDTSGTSSRVLHSGQVTKWPASESGNRKRQPSGHMTLSDMNITRLCWTDEDSAEVVVEP